MVTVANKTDLAPALGDCIFHVKCNIFHHKISFLNLCGLALLVHVLIFRKAKTTIPKVKTGTFIK